MTDLGKPGKRVLPWALGLGAALALAACSAPGGGFASGPEEPPRAEEALPAVSWEESPVEEPEEELLADPEGSPLLGGAGNPRYLLENGALRLRMEESP